MYNLVKLIILLLNNKEKSFNKEDYICNKHFYKFNL